MPSIKLHHLVYQQTQTKHNPPPPLLPLMLRWEEAKKQILRNLHVISRRDLPAWAALRVISDVNGPPSSPPRSPSVTHSQAASARRGAATSRCTPPREGRKDSASAAALSASSLAWTPQKKDEQPQIMPTVAKGNFPLSVFYSDAHVLRWEAAHS